MNRKTLEFIILSPFIAENLILFYRLVNLGSIIEDTMPRFNLPLSEEDAFVSLMSAIQVEVEFRRREFVATEELNTQVRRLSTFLTQENCKFGVVLAGGCGNGKTTIIKALQSLVNVLHIPNPYTDKEYVMRIIDAKSMAATCKSDYEDWKRLMYQDLLAIDDLGTEPRDTATLSTQPWIFSHGGTKINSSPSYPLTSNHLKYPKYMENASLTA